MSASEKEGAAGQECPAEKEGATGHEGPTEREATVRREGPVDPEGQTGREGAAEQAATLAPGGFHSGFVAILGRPNVGKSTLVNRLVGRKISIVSDHPQTTRRRITGVVSLPACQMVLLDLPGFQRPFDSLTRRMQTAVDEALREVDATLVMLNALEPFGGGDRYALEAVATAGLPGVVVLNKVDLVDGRRLDARLLEARALAGGSPVHAISALRGDGLGSVVDQLAVAMPPGPRYFPEGQSTDQPLELLVAELVREQALRRTRDEVPHAIAVEVSGIAERTDRPLVEVEAFLIVESESQKGIVVGKGGRVVKAIGSAARSEIESVFGVQVFLDLRVKVRRRWRRDERYVERLL